MPIRPENKALYGKDWPAISRRIREREGQRCKWCRAPNGKIVARGSHSASGTYMLEDGKTFDDTSGKFLGYTRGSEYVFTRMTKIVLTVAHLDHDPTNNADENLAALCQKCHLGHDQKHHQTNATKTRRSRKAAGDLFA